MINTINQWFGRLGNNIQQISNAIFYCMQNKINFYCPPHELINSFYIKFGQDKDISGRFFFYNTHEKDFDVNEILLNNSRKEICLKYIVPNFKFEIKEPLKDDILVIHLRGGDIFSKNPPNTYVPNPLYFYEKIINQYETTILVSEDKNNLIVENLLKYKNVFLQSSDTSSDFSTLLRTRNLVTSGVGTFSIAAALCSKNIKNLYCTDLYTKEHLNPEMLSGTNIKIYLTKLENYIKIGKWKNNFEQLELILKYQG